VEDGPVPHVARRVLQRVLSHDEERVLTQLVETRSQQSQHTRGPGAQATTWPPAVTGMGDVHVFAPPQSSQSNIGKSDVLS
jgi:hypothetical protein